MSGRPSDPRPSGGALEPGSGAVAAGADPAAEAHSGLGGQVVSYAVILAVSLALFWVAGSLPASRWEPLGAGAFPKMVLGLLALVSVLGLIGGLRRLRAARRAEGSGRASDGAVTGGLVRFRMVLVVLASFVVYVAVLRWIGFSVATFVFLLVLQLALGPKRAGAIAVMVAIAVVFSFGTDLLFAEAFNVFLPRSRIF